MEAVQDRGGPEPIDRPEPGWRAAPEYADVVPRSGPDLGDPAGADKFDFVLTGRAGFVVGETTVEARAGDLVLEPEGVPNGVAQATERTVLLVGIAPAPTSSAPL